MNEQFNPYKFNLHTTSFDIPNPCINALYGSLRRNCIARIEHLLSTEYDLKPTMPDTPQADNDKSPLLFIVNFPIVKTSSSRAFEAQTIRMDTRHKFIVRTSWRGLVFDIPAVELSTDTLVRIESSLTHDHHPF